MSYGFIYFLTNPSMPGLVKIGMTLKHPRERMAELSKATACPTPFEMLAFFDVVDPHLAEREIHAALDQYRVNHGREFFSAPLKVLQDQARQWIDTAEGCSCTTWLDQAIRAEFVDEFNRMILAES